MSDVRACPHSDARCVHGIDCPWSCATDAYDGQKVRRATPSTGQEPEIVQKARREVADPYTVTQWRIMWRHVIEAYELGLQATLARPDSALEAEARRNLAECPAAIMRNVESFAGWSADVALATIHAHANVLQQDIAFLARARDRAERVGEGQNPNEQLCDHAGWSFSTDGRGCPKCGKIVLDFGD